MQASKRMTRNTTWVVGTYTRSSKTFEKARWCQAESQISSDSGRDETAKGALASIWWGAFTSAVNFIKWSLQRYSIFPFYVRCYLSCCHIMYALPCNIVQERLLPAWSPCGALWNKQNKCFCFSGRNGSFTSISLPQFSLPPITNLAPWGKDCKLV